MFRGLLVLILFFLGPLAAQLSFPLQEIDDIAGLGAGWSDRKQANLGLAIASRTDAEDVLLQGADADGRPWILHLEPSYGMGMVRRVFRGDLDANGHDDLLIASVSYGNGRCIDRGDVITLMFDDHGRPNPWIAETAGLIRDADFPMTVLDVDSDGHAEIVLTQCEYADQMSEKRWISGIYEISEGLWQPLEPPLLAPYQEAAAVHLREIVPRDDLVHWDQPAEAAWPDLQAGWDAPIDLTLDALLGGEYGCDPYESSRRDPEPVAPPCTEGEARGGLRTSDGSMLPAEFNAVFESPERLDIRFDHSSGLAREILAAGYTLRAVGPPGRPSLLWIEAESGPDPAPLEMQLATTFVRSIPISLEDRPEPSGAEPSFAFHAGLASGSGRPTVQLQPFGGAATAPPKQPALPRGNYFSRAGRCFHFPSYKAEDLGWFQPVDDCAERIPQTAGLADTDAFLFTGSLSPLFVLSPGRRTLSARALGRIPVLLSTNPAEVVFEEVEGRPGDLVTTVPRRPDGYLAQWRLGANTWLAFHDRQGRATSPAIELDLEGELFHADRRAGLVFLVWEDGLPVEAKILRARFETVRAE